MKDLTFNFYNSEETHSNTYHSPRDPIPLLYTVKPVDGVEVNRNWFNGYFIELSPDLISGKGKQLQVTLNKYDGVCNLSNSHIIHLNLGVDWISYEITEYLNVTNDKKYLQLFFRDEQKIVRQFQIMATTLKDI